MRIGYRLRQNKIETYLLERAVRYATSTNWKIWTRIFY